MQFIFFALVLMNGGNVIFNFESPETSGRWQTIDDVVMGGISNSSFILNDDSTATFSGNVSPENNGGFASSRAQIEMNIAEEFKGVALRVKGDGNKYSLRFRTDDYFDGIAYQAKFETQNEKWEEIKIPFTNFKPTYRGRTIYDQPELKPSGIKQIGILISDKQFGPFILTIDWIRLY